MEIISGIDIVDIKRFGETLKKYNGRFIRRIFTERELKSIPEKDRIFYLSTSFSFKEAIWKALPDEKQKVFYFKDIEILWDGNKPCAVLKGERNIPELILHFFSNETSIITIAILFVDTYLNTD